MLVISQWSSVYFGEGSSFRDEIVVEIISLNGENYVGTITPAEARKTIFEDALGLNQSQLAGITIGYNRGRIVTFKLKQQMDLDDILLMESYEILSK